MKLYTEEQVVRAMSILAQTKPLTYLEVIKQLKPIELPSDEEIKNAANSQSHYEGAMWIKYNILKQ